MFYSETLLSKTGPLARVWLAANLERKLSKRDISQSNIQASVGAIVDRGQAPMALRLSGQLLLGVVRIYSRKARYLLDDCNEALLKLKLAFRPGNVDLPTDQAQIANPAAITIPVLTELDLNSLEMPDFEMPDPSLILGQVAALQLGPGRDPTVLDEPILESQITSSYAEPAGRTLELERDDLELDFGEGDLTLGPDTSIEMGMNAPLPRSAAGEYDEGTKFLEDDGLELDIGDSLDVSVGPEPPVPVASDHDIPMGGMDDFQPTIEEEHDLEPNVPAGDEEAPQQERDESPLSELRPSEERELEETYVHEQETTLFQPEEEDESIHHAQRAKRRKVLQADAETELQSHQIRALQEDRSHILKPASFLPRDPMLLALMEMQRNGAFVSNILGGGRAQGWAPELRGILSLEVVRRSGELKRKRDSGVADLEEAAAISPEETPQLELGEEEPLAEAGPLDVEHDTSVIGAEGPSEHLDEGFAPPVEEEEAPYIQTEIEDVSAPSPFAENFEDTTIPLLHPAESGPVSVGTKHAVHILRERFGSEAAESTPARQKNSVLFQDLLPEAATTKSDATKMFFEVLVLATKDAIKVEQSSSDLGGPIRIRGKRGLWGAWAEMEAGGEIASQTEASAVPA